MIRNSEETNFLTITALAVCICKNMTYTFICVTSVALLVQEKKKKISFSNVLKISSFALTQEEFKPFFLRQQLLFFINLTLTSTLTRSKYRFVCLDWFNFEGFEFESETISVRTLLFTSARNEIIKWKGQHTNRHKCKQICLGFHDCDLGAVPPLFHYNNKRELLGL